MEQGLDGPGSDPSKLRRPQIVQLTSGFGNRVGQDNKAACYTAISRPPVPSSACFWMLAHLSAHQSDLFCFGLNGTAALRLAGPALGASSSQFGHCIHRTTFNG
jgi:hypothetical protein